MKIFIIISLLSFQANAADLIFKQGFENTVLIKGLASAINSTGLSLELTVNTNTETLAVDNNGEFIFFLDVNVGDNWSVKILNFPSNPTQQGCALANASGIVPVGGVNSLMVTCNNNAWNWDEMKWDEAQWN